MQRSSRRILTTHVGSLIRPAPLLPFIRAKQNGEAYDAEAYAQQQLELAEQEAQQEGQEGAVEQIELTAESVAAESAPEAFVDPYADCTPVQENAEFVSW